MDNYTQGDSKEIEEPSPFEETPGFMKMQVNKGSKIRNLMGYATGRMKDDKMRKICWHGSGEAISKTITCAEILKRQNKRLHQITKIRYRKVEEYWEPKVEGLEKLRVNKNVPEIFILLSKDALDTSEPGYQGPGNHEIFWNETTKKKSAKKQKHQWKDRPENAEGASALAPGKKKGKNFKQNAQSAAKAIKKANHVADAVQKIVNL